MKLADALSDQTLLQPFPLSTRRQDPDTADQNADYAANC
jgi:hypothetical protein